MRRTVAAVGLLVLLVGCGSEPPAAIVTSTAFATTTAPAVTVEVTTVETSKTTATKTVTTTATPAAGSDLPPDAQAICDAWDVSMSTGIGPLMASYALGETIDTGDLYKALQSYEPPVLLDAVTMKEMLERSHYYMALQTAVYLILSVRSMEQSDLGRDQADHLSSAVMTGAGICSGTLKDMR